jgi:hypothetical protein
MSSPRNPASRYTSPRSWCCTGDPTPAYDQSSRPTNINQRVSATRHDRDSARDGRSNAPPSPRPQAIDCRPHRIPAHPPERAAVLIATGWVCPDWTPVLASCSVSPTDSVWPSTGPSRPQDGTRRDRESCLGIASPPGLMGDPSHGKWPARRPPPARSSYFLALPTGSFASPSATSIGMVRPDSRASPIAKEISRTPCAYFAVAVCSFTVLGRSTVRTSWP